MQQGTEWPFMGQTDSVKNLPTSIAWIASSGIRILGSPMRRHPLPSPRWPRVAAVFDSFSAHCLSGLARPREPRPPYVNGGSN
jgi:hypothetical protein